MSPRYMLSVLFSHVWHKRVASLVAFLITALVSFAALADDSSNGGKACFSIGKSEVVEGKTYSLVTFDKDLLHDHGRECNLRAAYNRFPIRDSAGKPLGVKEWERSVFAANQDGRPTVLRRCVPTGTVDPTATDEERAECPGGKGVMHYFPVPSNGWKAYIRMPQEQRATWMETQQAAAKKACAEATSPEARQACKDAGHEVAPQKAETPAIPSVVNDFDAKLTAFSMKLFADAKALSDLRGDMLADARQNLRAGFIGLALAFVIVAVSSVLKIRRLRSELLAKQAEQEALQAELEQARAQSRQIALMIPSLEGHAAALLYRCKSERVEASNRIAELEGEVAGKTFKLSLIQSGLQFASRDPAPQIRGLESTIAERDATIGNLRTRIAELEKSANDNAQTNAPTSTEKAPTSTEQAPNEIPVPPPSVSGFDRETITSAVEAVYNLLSRSIRQFKNASMLRNKIAFCEKKLPEIRGRENLLTMQSNLDEFKRQLAESESEGVALQAALRNIGADKLALRPVEIGSDLAQKLEAKEKALDELFAQMQDVGQWYTDEARVFENGIPELIRCLDGDLAILATGTPDQIMLETIGLAEAMRDKNSELTVALEAAEQACKRLGIRIREREATVARQSAELTQAKDARQAAEQRAEAREDLLRQVHSNGTDQQRKIVDAGFKAIKLADDLKLASYETVTAKQTLASLQKAHKNNVVQLHQVRLELSRTQFLYTLARAGFLKAVGAGFNGNGSPATPTNAPLSDSSALAVLVSHSLGSPPLPALPAVNCPVAAKVGAPQPPFPQTLHPLPQPSSGNSDPNGS